jgi:uncharacterized membrane protein
MLYVQVLSCIGFGIVALVIAFVAPPKGQTVDVTVLVIGAILIAVGVIGGIVIGVRASRN